MLRNVGRINSGSVVWQYPDYRAGEIAKAFKDGQFVHEIIKPLGRPKTQKQLAYYYSVVLPSIHTELLRLGFDVMGVPLTLDMADKIVKHYCNIKSKAELSIQECIEFINNAISWANNTLRITIPEPISYE